MFILALSLSLSTSIELLRKGSDPIQMHPQIKNIHSKISSKEAEIAELEEEYSTLLKEGRETDTELNEATQTAERIEVCDVRRYL